MSDEQNPKKSSYVPTPEVPAEVEPKLEAVLSVLARRLPEAQAARELGVSRHYFQTLKNRALKALVEELRPKPAGRPAKSSQVATLEEEVARLRKQNAKLQERVDTVDRLLGVASDLMHGRVKLTGRQKGKTATKMAEPGNEPEEPDGFTRLLFGARVLRQLGMPHRVIAGLLAMGESTLRRRLAANARQNANGGDRPARPRALDVHVEALVENEVRHFRALIGEEALRRRFGVSRRQARAIKRATLTAMEVERVRRAKRITVTMPGVIRGFDAMHVQTTEGWRYLLVAGDAAVPYRTSITVSETYDGHAVAESLERDFTAHGSPLFLRLDRARCHTTPEVLSVLQRHSVMVLQGPPRHPGYYGQLERQNRELRAWLDGCGLLSPVELREETVKMAAAWNSRLPRRTLAWRTAEEVWAGRTEVEVSRKELSKEVRDRAAQLEERLAGRGHAGLAERLATEVALKQRGWMIEEPGGWC